MARTHHVTLVNPLAGTLAHYSRALQSVLRSSGTSVDLVSVDEPSVRGGSRAGWVRDHLLALVRARRAPRGGTVIVTWPVLGWWDVPLARVAVGRHRRLALVVHDPVSLVRAVGYSVVARRAARWASRGTRIIVHSERAREDVERAGLGDLCDVLPLPIDVVDVPAGSERAGDTQPVVRVLGQYKAERDLALLASLVPVLGDDFSLEIHGRGWPDVPGWTVRDAFVPEAELDALIASASAVLIPYRRFYQSDIAIRAVGSGTPFVGPACDALTELYGPDSDLLVQDPSAVGEWAAAIRRAAVADRHRLRRRGHELVARAATAWAARTGS